MSTALNHPRFAYLSLNDPRDKKVWSGTHHSIYKALQSIGTVEILGPFEPKNQIWIGKVIHKICQKLLGKRFNYRHSFLLSRAYGKYFNEKIKQVKPDWIVAPAASCELACVITDVPIIYITDGTFASCLNYHKSLTNLIKPSIKNGNLIEQRAINKSKYVIVSSEWAAKSVIEYYHKNKSEVFNIPFGANFDKIPEEKSLEFTTARPFKLLFVGVYWDTKGGGIALNAFLRMNERGYDVALTIVGCEIPFEIEYPNLNVIKFIDKNSEEGQKQLAQIYSEHNLLLLPTRFDCTPIVINEASAFGLPCLVSKSGGVEGHLKQGINGYLIEYFDRGAVFASEIEDLILNPETYIALRKSSRQLYDSTLNWEHWKNEFQKIINS